MPSIFGLFSSAKPKTDLTEEQLQELDNENRKAWVNNVKGGFGALTLNAMLQLDIPHVALYFVGFCVSEPLANFSYNNRHKAMALGTWLATDGAKLVKEQVGQLPIFHGHTAPALGR